MEDLVRLRRVRDRIDREYREPLDVEALARREAMAFYRDLLGFEVRLDVGSGTMRWITVGPAGQPDTAIVLTPPAVDPGLSEAERQAITEMMAKGTYAGINLATDDLDGFFERVQDGGAEVVQEPIEQPYGLRDCAFRDPSGNMVRVQQSR
ncbi:VOC family protein [Citricoccus alkalitolerans]